MGDIENGFGISKRMPFGIHAIKFLEWLIMRKEHDKLGHSKI